MQVFSGFEKERVAVIKTWKKESLVLRMKNLHCKGKPSRTRMKFYRRVWIAHMSSSSNLGFTLQWQFLYNWVFTL